MLFLGKYLLDRSFTVYSGHEAFKFLFSEKKKVPVIGSGRLFRWSIILSDYNYQIIFRKGSNIFQVDLMSRLPSSHLVDVPECNIIYLSTVVIPYLEIQRYTENDVEMRKVKKLVLQSTTVHVSCVLYGNMVVHHGHAAIV